MIKISIARSILLGLCGILIIAFWIGKKTIVEPFLTHEEETKGTVRSLSIALDAFYKDTGSYPLTELGVDVLFELSEVNDRKSPYLTDKKGLLDEWGHPFIYFSPPECKLNPKAYYELYSKGENGIDNCGDGDDIYYSKITD